METLLVRFHQAANRLAAWWSFERMMVLLVALNFIDGISTHALLSQSSGAVELNPLMRWAWTTSPDVFWVLKLGLVSVGMTIIARLATDKVAKTAILSSCLFYLVVIVIHIQGWIEYFASR